MEYSVKATEEIVVVGAGLGGLCAAQKLSSQGFAVTVVDGAEHAGGLMQSQIIGGDVFDFGPHLIAATQVFEIDREIIDAFVDTARPWRFNQSPAQGHVYNGVLNNETGCPDLRTLSSTKLERARMEFLNSSGGESKSNYRNAEDWATAFYGRTVTDEFYKPVVRKLSGSELSELDPTVLTALNIPRVVLFDTDVACRLKEDPKHDVRLAFAKTSDGKLPGQIFYPRRGGIQTWVDYLRAKAESNGAVFRLGAAVERPMLTNGRVVGVRLRGGDFVSCDAVLWTAPPELLLRSLGEPRHGIQPVARDVQLYHFRVDGRYATAAFWVTNFDPRFHFYRSTLYDNFAPTKDREHLRLTVEVLASPGAAPIDHRLVAQELFDSQVVHDSDQVALVGSQVLKRALSIPAVGSPATREATVQRAHAVAGNLLLAGGGNAVSGQVAVIKDAHAVASSLLPH